MRARALLDCVSGCIYDYTTMATFKQENMMIFNNDIYDVIIRDYITVSLLLINSFILLRNQKHLEFFLGRLLSIIITIF